MKPEQIKTARQKLGLTQQRLADILEVPKNTVARWEQGVMKPTGRTLELALKALEIERLKKSTKTNLDEAEKIMRRMKTSR